MRLKTKHAGKRLTGKSRIRGRPGGYIVVCVLLVIIMIMAMAGCYKNDLRAEDILTRIMEDSLRVDNPSAQITVYSGSENDQVPDAEPAMDAQHLMNALNSYSYADCWVSSTINYNRLSVWGSTHPYQVVWVMSHNGLNQKEAAEELLNADGYAETLLCALLAPLVEEETSAKSTDALRGREQKSLSPDSSQRADLGSSLSEGMETDKESGTIQSSDLLISIEPTGIQEILERLQEPARTCRIETADRLVEQLADRLDSETAGHVAVRYAASVKCMDLISSLMENGRWKEAAEKVRKRYSDQFCKVVEEVLSENSLSDAWIPVEGSRKKAAMKASIMDVTDPANLYAESRLEMQHKLTAGEESSELPENLTSIYGTDILIGLGGLVTDAGKLMQKADTRIELTNAFSIYRLVRYAQYSGFLEIETEDSRKAYLKNCLQDLRRMTAGNPIFAEPYDEGKRDGDSPFILRKRKDAYE